MGCGAAGNAIQFVEKFDGVSFRHAFEILDAGKVAFSPAQSASRIEAGGASLRPIKQASVPRLEAPVRMDAGDSELFAQVLDYYHERLLKTPAAVEYLKGRGHWQEEAAKRFRHGFADRTLGLRIA